MKFKKLFTALLVMAMMAQVAEAPLVTSPIPTVSTSIEAFTLVKGQTLSFFAYSPYFSDGTQAYMKLLDDKIAAINNALENNTPVIINVALAQNQTNGYKGTISIYNASSKTIISQQNFPILYQGKFDSYQADGKDKYVPGTATTSTAISGKINILKEIIAYQVGNQPAMSFELQGVSIGLVQNIVIKVPEAPLVTSAVPAVSTSIEAFTLVKGQTLSFFAYSPYFSDGTQAYMKLLDDKIAAINNALENNTPVIINVALAQNQTNGYKGTISIYNASSKTIISQQNFPILYQGKFDSSQIDGKDKYVPGTATTSTAISGKINILKEIIAYQVGNQRVMSFDLQGVSIGLVQNIVIKVPEAPLVTSPIPTVSTSKEAFTLVKGQTLSFFAYSPYFSDGTQAYMKLLDDKIAAINNALENNTPVIINVALAQNQTNGYKGTISIYNASSKTIISQQNFPILYQGKFDSSQIDGKDKYVPGTATTSTAISGKINILKEIIAYQVGNQRVMSFDLQGVSIGLVQNIVINSITAAQADEQLNQILQADDVNKLQVFIARYNTFDWISVRAGMPRSGEEATPLIAATVQGAVNCLAYLLKNNVGFIINSISIKSSNGYTALHYASHPGKLQKNAAAIKKLIDRTSIFYSMI